LQKFAFFEAGFTSWFFGWGVVGVGGNDSFIGREVVVEFCEKGGLPEVDGFGAGGAME